MIGFAARVLRPALLVWSAITFLPAWLITIRGLFDGESYAWGVNDRIRGRGTGGYYPLAPITMDHCQRWSGGRRGVVCRL